MVSMCNGLRDPENFDSILEVLWCPSNAPGATFHIGAVGQCYNDDGDCEGLSTLTFGYPNPDLIFHGHVGYIPVLGVGNYPNTVPECGTFNLTAVEAPP
jgi:hypothetical protein